MTKLRDICRFQSGGTPSRGTPAYFNGNVPWITTVALNGDVIDGNQAIEWITDEAITKSAAKIVPPHSVMVGTRVGIGKVAINSVPMSTSQDIISLIGIDENKWDKKFICHLITANKEHLTSQARGATIKGIKIEAIADLVLPEISLKEQARISEVIGKVDALMHMHQQMAMNLEQLIKSRFIELFGDPVSNSMGLPTEPMTTVCAIIDGDRGKNYPKQDEFSDTGYCLFLNAKNVTATGFSFENRMFITKEKDDALHNGKLERGDVVLTTRGTLGNLAFYDDSVPFENVRINSGMVILRMKKSVMTEVFFMEQFKLQLQSIKGKIASGSAQPQLPISTMNKIRILLAPMALQEQFAAFVEQTDKSKLAVQKGLQELEILKKTLMQQYFG